MAIKQHSFNLATPSELRSFAEERLGQKYLSTGLSALSITSSPEEMLRLVHELQVHQIELEMQQEELSHISNELEERLGMYTELYDFAPVGYLTLGRNSKILQANLTATKLLGVDRSGLLGMQFKQFVVPQDYRVIDTLLETVFSKKAPGNCDVELLLDASQHSSLFHDQSGCIIRIEAAVSDTEEACRVILSDITDQKRKETDIIESKKRFSQALEVASAAVWEWNLKTNELIWSDELWHLSGLKRSDEKPSFKLWEDSIHPDDRKLAIQSVSEAVKNETELDFEYRVYYPDGSVHWIMSRARPLYNEKGDVGRYIGTVIDITERKQTEEALKKQKEHFKTLFDNHTSIMLVIDPVTRNIIDANDAAAEFYGWSIEELQLMQAEQISISSFDNLLDDITKIRTSELNKIIRKHKRADGSIRDVEITINLIVIEKKELFYAVINDITERKQAEQALRESERMFRSITEQISEVVFVNNSIGEITYVSPVVEKITGYKPDELLGHFFSEYMAEEEIPRAIAMYTDAMSRQLTNQVLEFLYRKKNGSLFPAEIHSQYFNDNGSSGVIGLLRDISERKLIENQLVKLSTAVEQSPAVVVITDPLGNVEYVNPAFTELTGYSIEETKGKNPRILQSGLMSKSVYEELWKTILSGGIWRGEFHNKKKNGELFWETAVISAVIDKNGVITNLVAVKEDITGQKTYLAELIAAKEKAEESDRLKSAFLANISHEIRTPMNGILGFTELLKEPHLSGEEQAEFIDLIQQSGHRMLNLINDLIDISRIDAEETKVEISETPLNKLVHDIHAFFKLNALSKGLHLTYNKGLSDSESIINTDSGKLTQILINLVNNAIKFTMKGGIDFGYMKKDDHIEFYVIDTGIGIPVSMKEKVFDRFRQVDNTLTRGYEGAGLGLSITKAFVTMLGGTIRVNSIDGTGTTFSFALPYNPVNAPKGSSPALHDAKAPKTLPHLCILIVEDDEASTLLLNSYLKCEDFTILCAVNGWEAVVLVQHHPEINLVLMDIKMPIMNGFEATRLIKQQRPDLPVIAQSAFTSKEDKEKAKEAGCDAFIIKPIIKAELINLINELLGASF